MRKSTKTPQERRKYPIGFDPRKERRRERANERFTVGKDTVVREEPYVEPADD